MALSINKNVEYNSGVIVPVSNAYIRIDSYSGNKSSASIYANTYLSKQSCEDGKEPIEPTKIFTFPHNVEENAPNIVKQGYVYLKTLPEYEDAIDC